MGKEFVYIVKRGSIILGVFRDEQEAYKQEKVEKYNAECAGSREGVYTEMHELK